MKNRVLFISGLVLTILGLMGILSNLTKLNSGYIVLGLGLVLLIANYFSQGRKR
jgi:hypothetical protein